MSHLSRFSTVKPHAATHCFQGAMKVRRHGDFWRNRVLQLSFALVLTWSCDATADARWEVPTYAPQDALPKLSATPVIDGTTDEWNAAAVVPLRFASYIAHRESKHQWNGPADCGMDVLCAWHDAGLCIAGIVSDDDVRNAHSGDAMYEQDCVEIFVDGRTDNDFMKPPYSAGTYHIFIRPPLDGIGAIASVRSDLGVIEGLRVAGKRNSKGWIFEMLIPWSAFPGFLPREGSQIGIQFGLDDYDARDGDLPQPLMMTCRGSERLSRSPDKFIRWSMTDAGADDSASRRDAVLALAAPDQICEKHPMLPNSFQGAGSTAHQVVVTPDMGATLELVGRKPPTATAAAFIVRDWTGKEIAQQKIALQELPDKERKTWNAHFQWAIKDAPDGTYRLEASLEDAAGKSIMRTERGLLVIAGLLAANNKATADALTRIEKAGIPKMTQTDPLRAAAWMGAAACVEKLKRGQELLDYRKSSDAQAELEARLTLLETGVLPSEVQSYHRLLVLASRPESQVTAEYRYDPNIPTDKTGRRVAITFRWGMIPIAVAIVNEFTNAAAAHANFEALHTGNVLHGLALKTATSLKDLSSETVLAGLRCKTVTRQYDYAPMLIEQMDTARQVLLYSVTNRAAFILDAAHLDCVQAEAVSIAEPLSKKIRPALQDWIKRSATPILPFNQAVDKAWSVLAGDTGLAEAQEILNGMRYAALVTVNDQGFSISALSGSRVIRVPGISKDAAVQILEMLAAGKAVQPEQTDRLRRAVVAALPRPTAIPTPATNQSLYCGDVHSHTFYSDGKASPVGLSLQAIHVGMGFLVITDHNTIEGAQVAAKLTSASGLHFPVIVGEEITTAWAHMNAYPLREVISWKLTPYETVQAAHSQGAVIGWNHPEWYFPLIGEGWHRQIMTDGWLSTGLDSWEHPTIPDYHAKKASGTLPPMVGVSDTHWETFDLFDSERTVIWAPSADGDDLAGAVRRGNVLLVAPGKPDLFYGSEAMCARAGAALAEGSALTNQAAGVIRKALDQADIPGLLRKSPPRIVAPEKLNP